jgi:hypothetical protein
VPVGRGAATYPPWLRGSHRRRTLNHSPSSLRSGRSTLTPTGAMTAEAAKGEMREGHRRRWVPEHRRCRADPRVAYACLVRAAGAPSQGHLPAHRRLAVPTRAHLEWRFLDPRRSGAYRPSARYPCHPTANHLYPAHRDGLKGCVPSRQVDFDVTRSPARILDQDPYPAFENGSTGL